MNLFDRILIHGDRRIQNYDESFNEALRSKIVYTGYVTDDSISSSSFHGTTPRVLINLGGGRDGFRFVQDFLLKTRTIPLLDKYLTVVSLGGQYTRENVSILKKIYPFPLECVAFIPNLLEMKQKAILSVSMGGYNNLTEALFHGIRSIVYPRDTDSEQKTRLDIFRRLGPWIYDGRSLDASDISKLLTHTPESENIPNISFDGAYFSASFLVNYSKYRYIKVRLTNACNAKCDMCGVIKRKWQHNDLEKIKNSIVDFYRLGGEVVNLTGGEPTIYQGFWDALSLSKGLGLITSVSTNGSTLGRGFFDHLYAGEVRLIDYIDISIDGLHEKHDERRKCEGLFAVIAENIQKLKDYGVFIHINVTVRGDNIEEMEDVFSFFKNIGVNSISLGMIASDPGNDTSLLIPTEASLKNFYLKVRPDILEQSGSISSTFSPNFSGTDIDSFIQSIRSKNSFPKPGGEKCYYIRSKKEIRINEGGGLSPCCIIDDFDEGLGNINNDRLLDIICSRKYESFLNRRFPNISEACLNCKII